MRKLRWLLMVALVLLFLTGTLAFGGKRAWGVAMTYLFPRDAALLAYQPPASNWLAVVQVPFGRIPEGENLRRLLEERAAEVERLSGVRLDRDVDAFAGSDAGVWVVRGRFDWARSSKVLAGHGFALGQTVGRDSATRGILTLAFDGGYLVVGAPAQVAAALERKDRKEGLGSPSPVVAGLDGIGWRHAALGAFADGQAHGSRLWAAGALDVPRGLLDLRGQIETENAPAAEKVRTDLERGRQQLLEELRRAPGAEPWVKVIAAGRLSARGPSVLARLRVPEPLFDELLRTVTSPLSALLSDGPAIAGALRSKQKDLAIAALEPEDAAPATRLRSRAPPSATPLLLAGLLLAGALLTIRRGSKLFLGMLLSAGFLVPALLTTAGAWFLAELPWRDGTVGAVLSVLSVRWPDLDQLLFGASAMANPLVYSAAGPLLLSAIAIRAKSLRTSIAAIACGFAAVQLTTAWTAAPTLTWLTSPWLSVPWLAVNAMVCWLIARALLAAAEGGRSRAV